MGTNMKPILFSSDMVRAILDGRKIQTRRIIKPQPNTTTGGVLGATTIYFGGDDLRKLPYFVGDILYVRETWIPTESHFGKKTEPKYYYRADQTPESEQCRKDFGIPWRPSIHMPREAARIFLEVTKVRAERLHDISEDDAICEGFRVGYTSGKNSSPALTARQAFMWSWQRLYDYQKYEYAWLSNPRVFVYEFKRTEVA